jgi:hypothetical protein
MSEQANRAGSNGTRLGRFLARLARKRPFVATVLAGGMKPSGRDKVLAVCDPHRFPQAALDAGVTDPIAWKCDTCDEWIYEGGIA